MISRLTCYLCSMNVSETHGSTTVIVLKRLDIVAVWAPAGTITVSNSAAWFGLNSGGK